MRFRVVVGLVFWCVACGGAAPEGARPVTRAEAPQKRVFAAADVRVPRREGPRVRSVRAPVAARPRWAGDSDPWLDYDCDELGYFTRLVDADAGGRLEAEEAENPLISCTSESHYDACVVRHVRVHVDCRQRCADAAWVLDTPRIETAERERLGMLYARVCGGE